MKNLFDKRISAAVEDIMGSRAPRKEYCERLVRQLIAEGVEYCKPEDVTAATEVEKNKQELLG